MEEQKQPQVTNDEQENQQGSEKEAQKTFTRDQIGAMVEAQVKAKLDDINSSWQSKLDDAVAKAKEDGKAEANMSAKELAEKEAKDREDKLKQQMANLDKRQHE